MTSLLINAEPVVANPGNFPCASDADAALTVPIPGLLSVSVLSAETGVKGNLDARATVASVTIQLGGALIEASAVRSVGVNESCETRRGFTKIATLDINGRRIIDGNVPGPIVIPANPLVVVAINEQVVTPDSLTVRAIHISSPLLGVDIVVSESIVDCHAG